MGLKGQVQGVITRTWRESTHYAFRKPTDCNLAGKEGQNKYLQVSWLFPQLAETNQNQRAGEAFNAAPVSACWGTEQGQDTWRVNPEGHSEDDPVHFRFPKCFSY